MKGLYCFDIDVLPVLFPDYIITTEKGITEGVCGARKEEGFVVRRQLGSDVDISLPDRWAVTQYAFSRKGKKVQKRLERYVSKIEKPVFTRELRLFMATGKWEKTDNVDVKVYELFNAFAQSLVSFLNIYFKLRSVYSFEELWSSILTFVVRVSRKDDIVVDTVSDYYATIIDKVRVQFKGIHKFSALVSSNHFDESMALNFLIEMRR